MGHDLSTPQARRAATLLERGAWGGATLQMTEATQKQIAFDQRSKMDVAKAYGIGPNLVDRLRMKHRCPLDEPTRSQYTPERGASILARFARGNNWVDSCEAEGVSCLTVMNWMEQFPAFKDARARAIESWGAVKAQEIQEIADSDLIDPKQKQAMIKSRQWMMEKTIETYRRTTPGPGTTNVTVNYLQLLQQAEQKDTNATVIEAEPAKVLKRKKK